MVEYVITMAEPAAYKAVAKLKTIIIEIKAFFMPCSFGVVGCLGDHPTLYITA
jgi:hypothetical protein